MVEIEKVIPSKYKKFVPYALGGLVLGVFVLMRGGGSSSPSSNVSVDPLESIGKLDTGSSEYQVQNSDYLDNFINVENQLSELQTKLDLQNAEYRAVQTQLEIQDNSILQTIDSLSSSISSPVYVKPQTVEVKEEVVFKPIVKSSSSNTVYVKPQPIQVKEELKVTFIPKTSNVKSNTSSVKTTTVEQKPKLGTVLNAPGGI